MVAFICTSVLNLVEWINNQIMPDYKRILKAIDEVIDGLSGKGVDITRNEIKAFVRFDPWAYQGKVDSFFDWAIEMAKKIKAGNAKRSDESIYTVYHLVLERLEQMQKRTSLLKKDIVEYLYSVIDEQFDDAMDKIDYKTASYYTSLKNNLRSAVYHSTICGDENLAEVHKIFGKKAG